MQNRAFINKKKERVYCYEEMAMGGGMRMDGGVYFDVL